MGEVLRVLAETTLAARDSHNKRLFVDLSESVHIHYREHRLVFGVNEFRHFAAVVGEAAGRLEQEVKGGYRSKSDADCRAGVQVPTIIIGGSQTESLPLENPERSKYFDERLVIEQQTPAVKDRFHVHYRDLRLVFNDDRNFLDVCDTFARAGAAYRAAVPTATIVPRWLREGVGPLDHVDVDVPVLLDRDGVIIDGHHRYYLSVEQGAQAIEAVQTTLSYDEALPIREFELRLKETRQWGMLRLYKRLLVLLCRAPREAVIPQTESASAA